MYYHFYIFFFTVLFILNFSEKTENCKLLKEVGLYAASAVHNASDYFYKVDDIVNISPMRSGGSEHFANNAGYNYAYNIEVPEHPDENGFNFIVPASMITEYVEVVWTAIRSIAEKIVELDQK